MLWRTMDDPTGDQIQAHWQTTWAGHKNTSWSPASTHDGPQYNNPVPNLQHLNLTSDQLLASEHHNNQDNQKNDSVLLAPSHNAHYKALCRRTSQTGHSYPPTAALHASSTDHNAQPVHNMLLSTAPVVSQVRNQLRPPPPSLPIASRHTQSSRPPPMPPCDPGTSHKQCWVIMHTM